MIRYFAYGSNIDPSRIKERLSYLPRGDFGILDGYKLEFNKIAANKPGVGWANIVKDDNGKVEGILYDISEEDLKTLDRCEGVASNHYEHITVSIKKKKDEFSAISYIACQNMTDTNLKPTRMYLDHLLKGKNCMSEKYFNRLRNFEVKID